MVVRHRPQTARWSKGQRWLAGTSLLAAGAIGGGILASTMTAGAATSPATTAPASEPGSPPARGGPSGASLSLSGTVTAVGASSVTIKTSAGTTSYAVTSSSDIDKNGEATLRSLAVGDTVTFNTLNGAAEPTIDKLHAGNQALDWPTGPSGGGPSRARLSLSGTVTAVGASSVTIKTSTGTTTYAVTSSSDIDKNGEATLRSLAVGDTVTFNTLNGAAVPTIDKLHAGNQALDWPTGPAGAAFGGPGGNAPTGSEVQ